MNHIGISFKDFTPEFTLEYVDEFYFMCEMSDRTIIIQNVGETDIQFDVRFKSTKNCFSYTITLSPYEYKVFKESGFKLDSLKSVIEKGIVNYIFNYVDESMIAIINEHVGKNKCLSSFKTSESISVETNVYYFTMKMSRFDKDDYVPYNYEETFIFDSIKNQVYIKKQKLDSVFMSAFELRKFTTCKINLYESLTNNDFKCIIDNALLGTVVCYSANTLFVYDNTFGDVKEFNGDYEFICTLIFDIIRDVIKAEPSPLMNNYLGAYSIDLDTLSNKELTMILMSDY